MPSQRKFVIALWTILSAGVLAMFARSYPAPQAPADQPEAQLANMHVEAAGVAER